MNILDSIAAYSAERVRRDKEKISLEKMKEKAKASPERALSAGGAGLPSRGGVGEADGEVSAPIEPAERSGAFYRHLKKDGLSFICEIKKASPSKGLISPDFPYLEIAEEYDRAGADCISCLTEPKWFLGSDEIFTEIRAVTDVPMIRKDFTVDEYQIYQAKCMGADAVLLICALLDAETLERFLGICGELKIDALVEAHNEEEIRSGLSVGAKIIGVNNRDLKDFSVDISNAERLRSAVPSSCAYVVESGVSTAADVARIKKLGADAVLIGEAFMRSDDKAGMLRSFREIV